jgi:peptidoglycan/xylan/chitin deacetylase (PgdA/CDA1 family)
MPGEVLSNTARGSWKQVVTEGLYRTGILRVMQGFSQQYELRPNLGRGGHLRRVRSAKYVVLTYHRVGTEGVPLYCSLPCEVFAKQIRYVARRYRVISLRQMVDELQDPDRTGQAVAITFDDGYLGTYTEAFPVLKEYGLPATVYLAAGAVESGEILWYDRLFLRFQKAGSDLTVMLDKPRTYRFGCFGERIDAAQEAVMYLRTLPDSEREAWCDDFARRIPLSASEVRGAMMTWEQARAMQRDGICFGTHTMTHPVVSRLGAAALRRELGGSKALIETRLNCAAKDFAFPFGKPSDCGSEANEALAGLGYQTATTSIVGVNRTGADLFRLRRLGVGNSCSIAYFALQLQRLFLYPTDEELSSPATSEVRRQV